MDYTTMFNNSEFGVSYLKSGITGTFMKLKKIQIKHVLSFSNL